MDEDVALAALLTALEDLHNIRNEMHACIKQASIVLQYVKCMYLSEHHTGHSAACQSILPHHPDPSTLLPLCSPQKITGYRDGRLLRRVS